MNYNRIDILLANIDDCGVETEADVAVYFIVQPAEPDVGIANRYGEISHVAMPTPLGELIFTPTSYHMEQLQEKLGIEIYENQFAPDDGH